MREFHIPRNPYDDHIVYRHPKFTIEPGITVLVGCNGSGKSTMLKAISQQLQKEDIPVYSFDNYHEGGSWSMSRATFFGDYNFVCQAVTSSEGERIVLNTGNAAKECVTFMNSHGEKRGVEEEFINRFNAVIHSDNGSEDKPAPKEYWILLDAIDSGLSVDNIVELKEYFLKPFLEDFSKNAEIYIVVSANEYELCRGERCFDVQEGKYVPLNSYEQYRRLILKSRKYKDARIEGAAKKSEKKNNN